jgi:hypothetical protein
MIVNDMAEASAPAAAAGVSYPDELRPQGEGQEHRIVSALHWMAYRFQATRVVAAKSSCEVRKVMHPGEPLMQALLFDSKPAGWNPA